MIERVCLFCKKTFNVRPSVIKDGGGKFCSKQCFDRSREVIIKCLCCGKEFYTKRSEKDRKFCSRECRMRHAKENRDPARYLKCLHCEKEFYVKPGEISIRKFCSHECCYNYKIENYDHLQHENNCICKQCGKEFYKYPSVIKVCGDRFCSKECHVNFQRGGMSDEDRSVKCLNCGKEFLASPAEIKRDRRFCSKKCFYEEHGKIEKICEHCGKIFYIRPSKEKDGCGKFCSKKCFYDEHKKIKLTCEVCGKEFWEGSSRSDVRRFCSRKCSIEGMLIGDKNHNWRGGKRILYCELFNNKFKEKIREKFDRKCFICGEHEEENIKRLSVHHIDYFKASICRGKDWAFVPLCMSCHSQTNYNRYFWFNLLISYWTSNPEIHLNDGFGI